MEKETIELVKDAGNEIKNAISILAEQLGVASEHFYPIFVKQQVVEGVTSMIVLGFFFILGATSGVVSRKIFSKEVECNSGTEALGILTAVACGVILIICVCFSIVNARNDISKILNPEYYAAKEILEMIK